MKECSTFQHEPSRPGAIKEAILHCSSLIRIRELDSVSIRNMIKMGRRTPLCMNRIRLNPADIFSHHVVLLYRHPLAIYKKHVMIHISSASDTRGNL